MKSLGNNPKKLLSVINGEIKKILNTKTLQFY